MDEQTREIIVRDKPAELSGRINNILSALLLGAAVWVASSLEDLKEAVVVLATNQEHNVETLVELKALVKDNDKRLHTLERLHPEFYGVISK